MNADILVVAPHPDDAELCCGGLLLKASRAGLKCAVVDVTQGELGTRGSVAIRQKETAAAARILRLIARENLNLPDGHLHDNEVLRKRLVRMLRRFRPRLFLVPHWEDQHPDHSAVGQAAIYAAFLTGVPKFDPPSSAGVASNDRLPYRPKTILHYNNRYGIAANVVIDISDVLDAKLDLVRCYQSQFGPGPKRAKASGPQTRLSQAHFLDWVRSMHQYYGMRAGVRYGEGYVARSALAVHNVSLLM